MPHPSTPDTDADRRRLMKAAFAAGGLALLGAAPAAFAQASARRLGGPIINALGSLDDPNDHEDGDESPTTRGRRKPLTLSARVLRDARASGVTAVNCTLGYVSGKGDPFEVSVSDIARYDRMIRAQSADVVKILTAADIVRAQREGRVGIIYGFQNATMFGNDLDRVDLFADLGLRVAQLTYNPANPLGDGSMAPQNRGLTPWGREVVARLNHNRLMVDLSHSGQNTCLDAIRVSRQPVSINHTGCRALTDLPRNKSDEELRLLAEKGGFAGIYFMPFLRLDGKATAADVVAHIEHAVTVCGEDHVGIGTDGTVTAIDDLASYRAELAEEIEQRRKAGISATGEGPDTLPFVIDLRGPAQFQELADRLSARGHSGARIEKILGGNFLRYANDVWGS